MTDLTQITTPFGLLDEGTKAALRNCGGPYQWWRWETQTWRDVPVLEIPKWSRNAVYRVKPLPPKPREWWAHLEVGVTLPPERERPGPDWVRVREVQP